MNLTKNIREENTRFIFFLLIQSEKENYSNFFNEIKNIYIQTRLEILLFCVSFYSVLYQGDHHC